MRHELAGFILAFLMVFGYAQGADSPASHFTGTWEGQMNDQPAIQLVLTAKGGKVDGTIGFYSQRLGKDRKWHVEGDPRWQPLIAPQVNGNTLTFEVLHHKCHGCSELGPNKKFRVEVNGSNETLFREAGVSEDAPGRGLKLLRKTR